jgi:CRISPR-associated protein Cmr5
MTRNHNSPKMLTRDQRRALHAYDCVDRVPKDPNQQKDYKIAVNDLGANILRSGLCGALAAVQRLGARGGVLLEHLASAGVPGLEGAKADDLAQRVRELDVEAYIIATREMLQVALWLKRATQVALGGD